MKKWKHLQWVDLFEICSKKNLRIMKLTILLLMAVLFNTFGESTYSQNVRINLDMRDASIQTVLSAIEEQSKFYFLYSSKMIDVSPKVDVQISDKKINEVLNELLAGTDIQYYIKEQQILLVSKGINAAAILQQGMVTGTVTDVATGEPLPGVNVLQKGTLNGTTADVNGAYSLSVPQGSTLVFTYIGMKSQEIIVGNNLVINVSMEEEATELEQIVVTGYTTQKKVDLTGAISVVDLEEIIDLPTSNPMQAMQGRVPGLYIETTGSPTGETNTVLIRGLNTLGNTDPLYIIDGVPTKRQGVMQSLDPATIESIQVLKDASASSIYGARASNGVIIITTKEGTQRIQVELNTNLTFQNYSWLNKVDMCNTIERGEILWQASINDGTDPSAHSALYSYDYTGTGANAVLNKVTPVEWIGGDPAGRTKAQVPGTDWQDIAYRNALQSNTSLTISGGNKNSTALLGLGYLDNDGIMKYTDYKKLSVRINSSHSFFDGKIKIGENLQLAKTAETPTGGDLGGPFLPLGKTYSGGNMESLAVMLQPILPVYTEDGGWAGPLGSGFSDRNNVLHMLYIHRNNKKNSFLTFGNLNAELKLIENMIFRSNFGIDYTDSYDWWFEEKYVEGYLRKDVNSLEVLQEHRINWSWSNTLTYNLTLDQHSFNILAGTEALKEDYYTLGARKENFALQDVNYRYINAGTGAQTNNGLSTGYRMLSFFGKVNYGLSNRYLASVTLRYDGSSRFGKENRFGLFPAATVGWRINNEKFFNLAFVSNLKLRAGIGRVGNQEIGDVARYGLYATNYGTQDGARNVGTAYDLSGIGSGTLTSGYVSIQTENESLKWESTDELNIGIDFGLLSERIIGSFDYFTRKSKDILIKPPYPGVVGEGGNRWENGATIENKGFEIVLGYRDKIGKLSYSILGSISSFHDEITYLPASVVRSYPGNVEKTILGHSQTSVFGYVTDGIFQNQAEVDAHATQAGKGIGRIRR